MARWVECWTADSENRSGVGSNPSGGSHDRCIVVNFTGKIGKVIYALCI